MRMNFFLYNLAKFNKKKYFEFLVKKENGILFFAENEAKTNN